jgi:hypothetical protein
MQATTTEKRKIMERRKTYIWFSVIPNKKTHKLKKIFFFTFQDIGVCLHLVGCDAVKIPSPVFRLYMLILTTLERRKHENLTQYSVCRFSAFS